MVGTVSGCKIKVNISFNKCPLLNTINYNNYSMFRQGSAILRKSSYRSYTINITIYVPFLPICCWYVINGVPHSACVGWYIDCKNMHIGNNRILQNGWINIWTEGTVAVSGKSYTVITGVLGHQLVWKHKCCSCVDATYCHKVLRGPSVSTNPVLVSNHVTWVARVPQLQLCRLHCLLSVRYVSDVHSPVL